MAEAFSRKYYPDYKSRSAGVNVGKQGDAVPFEVWEVMNDKGLDLKHHRRVKLNCGMVDSADKILVLCDKNECPDYLISSNKAEFWQVDDPVGGYDSMIAARDNIEEQVKNMFDE